jgi:hypothetical protein
MHSDNRRRQTHPQRRAVAIYVRGVYDKRNTFFVVVSRAYYSVIYRATS